VCEVIGDAGKARYDYYANQVEFHDLQSRTTEVFRFDRFDRNEMFLEELRHFLRCVRGEERPAVDLAEAVRSMRIGLAAEESLRTGKAVEMADPRHEGA
jgi:predicted dehydrogenase